MHKHTHTHTHTHRIKSSLKKLSWKRIHFWFGKFPTVEDLLDHFESKPVIGGESGASVDTRYYLVISMLCKLVLMCLL